MVDIKAKNKSQKGRSNEKQNKYLDKKREESKTGLKYLPAKRDKTGEKKKEKKVSVVGINAKLDEPTKGWNVDSSFFNQEFLQGKEKTKKQAFDETVDDNFDVDVFGDALKRDEDDDGQDGDMQDDMDLLDYADDAIDYDGDEDEDYEGGGSGYRNTMDNVEVEDASVYFEDQYSLAVDQEKIDRQKMVEESFKSKDDHLLQSFPSIGGNDRQMAVSMDDDEDDEDGVDGMGVVKTEKKKKMGGFQGMDLHRYLFKAIMRKGYKQPTPIQRSTIPLILEGQDVVGMARTGSGKTAAFVIPMLQKLTKHSNRVGARAIILSPTREIALQTFRVVRELSVGSDIRACVIVGGDNMSDQFAELARNPDIIIATPGRLMHHLQEVGMGLKTVEYIVFDEADRLFEMGFSEQLHEIISKLSTNRQTLLFSATLPSMLAEFVRAGLSNPKLVRLNTDTKISDDLKMSFFTIRHDEKIATLLYLLKEVVKEDEPTMVFISTKFHVEYLHLMLNAARIDNTFIHGHMDAVARKINLAKFRSKTVNVMLVTDLAARGIDIPMLDNVINYDFAPKEKIFIHRVGRVARAGRKGTAYSLVSPDEIPYMIDLHLYIGKKLTNQLSSGQSSDDLDCSFYGNLPQQIIDRENEFVKIKAVQVPELLSLKKTIFNAYNKYIRTRPAASHESNKRAKLLDRTKYHPSMGEYINEDEFVRNDFVQSLKSFRPGQTVFELGAKKGALTDIMVNKRNMHSEVIGQQIKRVQNDMAEAEKKASSNDIEVRGAKETEKRKREDDDEEYLYELEKDTFEARQAKKEGRSLPKKNLGEEVVTIEESEESKKLANKKKTRNSNRDDAFFISSTPSNYYQERAMSVSSSMTKDDEVNLGGNDEGEQPTQHKTKWDRKKKKFVSTQAETDRLKEKKKWVRNEAGVLVDTSKSTKSLYQEWKKKTNSRIQRTGEEENTRNMPDKPEYTPVAWRGNRKQAKKELDTNGGVVKRKTFVRSELKDIGRIRKDRAQKLHNKIKHAPNPEKNKKNKKKK